MMKLDPLFKTAENSLEPIGKDINQALVVLKELENFYSTDPKFQDRVKNLKFLYQKLSEIKEGKNEYNKEYRDLVSRLKEIYSDAQEFNNLQEIRVGSIPQQIKSFLRNKYKKIDGKLYNLRQDLSLIDRKISDMKRWKFSKKEIKKPYIPSEEEAILGAKAEPTNNFDSLKPQKNIFEERRRKKEFLDRWEKRIEGYKEKSAEKNKNERLDQLYTRKVEFIKENKNVNNAINNLSEKREKIEKLEQINEIRDKASIFVKVLDYWKDHFPTPKQKNDFFGKMGGNVAREAVKRIKALVESNNPNDMDSNAYDILLNEVQGIFEGVENNPIYEIFRQKNLLRFEYKHFDVVMSDGVKEKINELIKEFNNPKKVVEMVLINDRSLLDLFWDYLPKNVQTEVVILMEKEINESKKYTIHNELVKAQADVNRLKYVYNFDKNYDFENPYDENSDTDFFSILIDKINDGELALKKDGTNENLDEYLEKNKNILDYKKDFYEPFDNFNLKFKNKSEEFISNLLSIDTSEEFENFVNNDFVDFKNGIFDELHEKSNSNLIFLMNNLIGDLEAEFGPTAVAKLKLFINKQINEFRSKVNDFISKLDILINNRKNIIVNYEESSAKLKEYTDKIKEIEQNKKESGNQTKKEANNEEESKKLLNEFIVEIEKLKKLKKQNKNIILNSLKDFKKENKILLKETKAGIKERMKEARQKERDSGFRNLVGKFKANLTEKDVYKKVNEILSDASRSKMDKIIAIDSIRREKIAEFEKRKEDTEFFKKEMGMITKFMDKHIGFGLKMKARAVSTWRKAKGPLGTLWAGTVVLGAKGVDYGVRKAYAGLKKLVASWFTKLK